MGSFLCLIWQSFNICLSKNGNKIVPVLFSFLHQLITCYYINKFLLEEPLMFHQHLKTKKCVCESSQVSTLKELVHFLDSYRHPSSHLIEVTCFVLNCYIPPSFTKVERPQQSLSCQRLLAQCAVIQWIIKTHLLTKHWCWAAFIFYLKAILNISWFTENNSTRLSAWCVGTFNIMYCCFLSAKMMHHSHALNAFICIHSVYPNRIQKNSNCKLGPLLNNIGYTEII